MTDTALPASSVIRQSGVYAWYVALLLALGHLVSFIDRFLVSLLAAPLKAEFHLSDTQLGLLQGTGFVILYTVVAIPLGRIADRTNRRNLIVAGLVFWSLSTALCGLAGSFGWLFAARVGVGLGEAALVPAAMSLIAAYFAREQLGKAVSLFTTGASLGKSAALIGGGLVLAVLTATGGLMLPLFGLLEPWQGVFVVACIPGVLLALLILFTVGEPPRPARSRVTPGVKAAVAHIRANLAAYLLHTGASSVTVLLIQSLAAWAPLFYVRMMGLTPSAAGVAVGSVILLAGPAGHLSGGFLTDRLSRAGVSGPAGTVIAGGLVCAIPCAILFAVVRDLKVSLLAYGLLNYFLTMAAPASLAGVQMLTPDRLRGMISSMFLCCTTLIGIGMGPPLVGLITDKVFRDEMALDRSLLTMLLVFCVLGAGLGWASRKAFSRTVAAVRAEA